MLRRQRNDGTSAPSRRGSRVRPLTISDYERHARKTDKLGRRLDTPLLGLFGEVGSLVSAIKKRRRDKGAFFAYEATVIEELGDVLWYLAAVTRRSGILLVDVFARGRRDGASRSQVLRFDHFDGRPSAGSNAKFETSLMQLAGEAGDIIKRYNSGTYRRNADALRGDLIKFARPLIRAAAEGKIGLAVAARKNIEKIEDRWVPGAFPGRKDEPDHVDEQIPRKIRMQVYERKVSGKKFVYQKCNGILIGDRLTDNHMEPDDYRFHDVFHLAYAANLGWSPVTRALFRVKRRSDPKIDENEDGARAILIEEGLTTWIFEKAKDHKFFLYTPSLSFDLLKAVKDFVRGYEPAGTPLWLWEKAILDGYSVFRQLRRYRRGLIVADLGKRSISFQKLRKSAPVRRRATRQKAHR
jgi:NTP pyrophosphatase (non-canonical NTP hydrolase)